jgi:hypothetical protein
METSTLSWWKNVAEIAAWTFAVLAAVATGLVWFTGRSLERRHAAEEIALRPSSEGLNRHSR